MANFDQWEKVAFRCVGSVAFLLCCYSMHLLRTSPTLPLTLMPFTCLALAYVNFLASVQQWISPSSTAAYAADALQACIAPSILVIAFESVYHLHSRRHIKFCGLSFDEGAHNQLRGNLLLWSVRILAVGLFVIGLLVNFELVSDDHDHPHGGEYTEGNIGYLSKHTHGAKNHALAVIPTSFMLLGAIIVAIEGCRYGAHSALSITAFDPWAIIFFGTMLLVAGEFFHNDWYLVTSNLGRVIFLLCLIIVGHIAGQDLQALERFENFLAKTNPTFHPEHANTQRRPSDHGRAETIVPTARMTKKEQEYHTHRIQVKPPTQSTQSEQNQLTQVGEAVL